MQVSLTPELEAIVRRELASGLYQNEGEVIREVLRLMAARDRTADAKLQLLRDAIAAGEASGPVVELDLDDLSARLDKEASRAGLTRRAHAGCCDSVR
jgi:putative addiction module CopG family antidote